jgi:hypothetical protein
MIGMTDQPTQEPTLDETTEAAEPTEHDKKVNALMQEVIAREDQRLQDVLQQAAVEYLQNRVRQLALDAVIRDNPKPEDAEA